jgi:hypothetical protein
MVITPFPTRLLPHRQILVTSDQATVSVVSNVPIWLPP